HDPRRYPRARAERPTFEPEPLAALRREALAGARGPGRARSAFGDAAELARLRPPAGRLVRLEHPGDARSGLQAGPRDLARTSGSGSLGSPHDLQRRSVLRPDAYRASIRTSRIDSRQRPPRRPRSPRRASPG